MISVLKKYWQLLLVFAVTSLIFYPSLFAFYTNDDFFFLKISHVNSLQQFLNFFSLAKGPDGFGMYRPLTTQAFYFLSWKVFNLNPLPLHVISFSFFFGIVYVVYELVFWLASNYLNAEQSRKTALLATLLYAVSATHFSHFYYLATFQELGMTLFVLLSCLSFAKQKNFLSFIFFLLALMSKETAVVTPFLLVLIYWFRKSRGRKVLPIRKFFLTLIPFVICLFAYLFIRVKGYGLAEGDSYIWDFSFRKLFNTLFWYLLWSFNLPETLLDFIGPGLKVNPNLFLYWSKQAVPIFILFALELLIVAYVLLKALWERNPKLTDQRDRFSIFSILWFLISLLPVVFLPLHKFPFYLTLPLIGLTFRIAYLFVSENVNEVILGLFVAIWVTTAVLTTKHTISTNWVTQGEKISRTTYDFISKNLSLIDGKDVTFVDTINDLTLPWSPTVVVKTALSGENFFAVFFPSLAGRVHFGYIGALSGEKSYIITSRSVLGY